jgi:hypothetical protein
MVIYDDIRGVVCLFYCSLKRSNPYSPSNFEKKAIFINKYNIHSDIYESITFVYIDMEIDKYDFELEAHRK